MSSLEKYQISYHQGCKRLLQEPEIKFAGVINPMGILIGGGMKEGLTPLEDEEDRRKVSVVLKPKARLPKNLLVSDLERIRKEHIRKQINFLMIQVTN